MTCSPRKKTLQSLWYSGWISFFIIGLQIPQRGGEHRIVGFIRNSFNPHLYSLNWTRRQHNGVATPGKYKKDLRFTQVILNNSPNWTRTNDLAVNSRSLYQLSYRGSGTRNYSKYQHPHQSKKLSPGSFFLGVLVRHMYTQLYGCNRVAISFHSPFSW